MQMPIPGEQCGWETGGQGEEGKGGGRGKDMSMREGEVGGRSRG